MAHVFELVIAAVDGRKVKDTNGNIGKILEVRETTALVLFGTKQEIIHLSKLSLVK